MNKASWMNRFTKPLAALLGAAALLALAACGGGGTGTTSPNTAGGPLGVSPNAVVMDFGSAPATLIVSGGVKPYALTSSLPTLIPVTSSIAEDGRFAISALYLPDIDALVTLTIRDAAQATVTAQITVNGKQRLPLSISPSTTEADANVPVTFIISGGVQPYTVTTDLPNLVPAPNAIGQDGRFTVAATSVPNNATLVTITVRDKLQATTTALLTIHGRQDLPLTISPTTADTGVGVPVTFTITGGVSPYSVTSSQPSIIPNPITVDSVGRFTVQAVTNPPVNASVVLTVRDTRNTTVTATLTVRSLALAVSPTTATTIFGVPVAYQISGGQAPYSVTSSFPTIVANPTVDSNGRFTITPLINPPGTVDMVLTVSDAAGNQVTSALHITPTPLSVTPTAVTVAANVPVTFTITGGTTPYTVVSSLPSLVPNPASIDAQGRFTLRATSTPTVVTPVLITIRDAAQNVVTATMTVLPTTPVPLSLLPQTATVYYNTPATLTVIGGTPPYQAFSTDSVVLPVARNVIGDQILLAPANVAADTTVTITVTDASGVSVTATVTVKPAPLLNTLTITPTPASPGVGCGSAVCAGQTASVTVLVRNLAGAGIQGRAVKFENVQGNYQFLTNAPGSPETLANSITVTTGQDGLAVVRLKADVNAPTQVALIRATELTTGNVLNSSFVIAQFTDGAGTLTAIPTTWTVAGPDIANCAGNTPVTYYIFGGTPPYRIQSTLPNFVNIVPTLVLTNGGGFTAILTGAICSPAPGTSITITDATGRTIAVQLINAKGIGNPTTNFDAIGILPGTIASPILACGQSITEQIVGGNTRLADGTIVAGTFVASSPTPGVTAILSGRTIVITRTTGTTVSPATIFVSNGTAPTVSFTVAIEPVCGGSTPDQTLFFTPSPLRIACAAASAGSTIITTGALPPFTALPSPGLLMAFGLNPFVMTVTRSTAVVSGSASIPVFVTDLLGTTVGVLMVAPTANCL